MLHYIVYYFHMGQGPYGPGPIWAGAHMGRGPYGPGPRAPGPVCLSELLTEKRPVREGVRKTYV